MYDWFYGKVVSKSDSEGDGSDGRSIRPCPSGVDNYCCSHAAGDDVRAHPANELGGETNGRATGVG